VAKKKPKFQSKAKARTTTRRPKSGKKGGNAWRDYISGGRGGSEPIPF
jgi:hypothetical protein